MSEYPFDRSLSNQADVLDYYVDAIHYRNTHKDHSTNIAMHVFDRTHPRGMLPFPVSDKINRLRDEFGALEAPGSPNNGTQSIEDYDDMLWLRLLNLVNEVKEKWTF